MQLDSKHIVCGRGQRNYNNEGNLIFRRVVERRLAHYMDKTTRRAAKTKLVDETTRKLFEMNMVFVTRTSDNRDWVKLSNRKARTKVAHLFRDASRQARRCIDWKSISSRGNWEIPAESDRDESWSLSSLFSPDDETNVAALSDDETDIAAHSDADFSDIVGSRMTLCTSDFKDEVTLTNSIGAIGARSGDKLSSQQHHVFDVVNSPDILGLHGSLTIKYLDAMESALDELQMHSSNHNSLKRYHFMHELEGLLADSPNTVFLGDHTDGKFVRSLLMADDNEAWTTLSAMEHVNALCGPIRE